MMQEPKEKGSGEKVRVCHILPRFSQGGAETQVLLNLESADRDRFEVHLCLMKTGDTIMEARARELVTSTTTLGFRWRSSFGDALRLRRYLEGNAIDVVHCHLPLADTFGRVVAAASGVPVLVTTEHGKHLWKTWPHRVLDRVLNHRTAARICVSEDIASIRRSREGLSIDKSPVIPNAVDLNRVRSATRNRNAVLSEFGWAEDSQLVVAVGRLVDAKNYPLLIAAVQQLQTKRPQLRCVIAGGGPLHAELQTKVDRAQLGDIVRLAGPRTDIPDLLQAAHVYALSSIREGLPVALLEAMACGLPVVATPAGGVKEILHDRVNGLMVPHEDPTALAKAIDSLFSDPGWAERLGRRAAADIEEGYDIRCTVRRMEELYIAALSKAGFRADALGKANKLSDGEALR